MNYEVLADSERWIAALQPNPGFAYKSCSHQQEKSLLVAKCPVTAANTAKKPPEDIRIQVPSGGTSCVIYLRRRKKAGRNMYTAFGRF
jgi:hypothetical protein